MSTQKLFTEFSPVSTENWEKVIALDLKGADYEKKLVWKTPDGLKIKPYYRAEDLNGLDYLQTLPGEYPYVRGNRKEGNTWEVRQNIWLRDVKKVNALAVDALNKGAQSVGLCAKEAETPAAMEALLQNIDPTRCGIHFIGSHSYPKTLALFVDYLEKHKIDTTKVYGSLNFDPFHYAFLNGKYYETLDKNIAELKELFARYAKILPKFRFITVNAQMLHNSAATSTQELGFGLAWANEYLYKLSESGILVEEIAARMTMALASGSNYFVEIAKIRACRLLWASIVSTYTSNKDAARIFIHSESSRWNKSLYDPFVNMLRSTTEAMSSAIGGADSISVRAYDFAFENPDDFSTRIARNQQIILKEESFMDKIADPAGGSYYIENLTHSIAQYAWDHFKSIEEKGGFAQAIESNFIQEAIEKTAQERNLDIATRKIFVLGTNQYPNLNESMSEKIHVKEDNACDCTHTAFKCIPVYRGSEGIEELRLATERHVAKGGKKPVIFLLPFGNLAMRKARAGFALNFYGCAGYELIDSIGFKTAEEGAKAALEAKADVVVLCSSDEEYETLVPEACSLLKGKCSLVLAGYPKEQVEAYKAAGIDDFIHIKSNLIEILSRTNKSLLK